MSLLKTIIKSLPLFGGLVNCNTSDFKVASKDISTNFIFSTMPIWLGVFLSLILSKETTIENLNLFSAIMENIKNGELYLLATATLGPIIYIAFGGDLGGGNKFPTKLSHMIFVSIIIALSAIAFGIQRSTQTINHEFYILASMLLFVFSWILLSLATVYKRQSIPPADKEFKKNEMEFSDSFGQHRKKQ